MALALAMARINPKDVGPDVAYSVATGTPHRRQIVVLWLAEKLLIGTGQAGKRNERLLTNIAGQSYDLVVGTRREATIPYGLTAKGYRDFELLSNIAQGWLWMSMEAAVERAEYAMHFDSTNRLAEAS